MSMIIFLLCVTILVANLVLAVPEEDNEEDLSQDVQELHDYQISSLAFLMFLSEFADPEDDSVDELNGKCRRPLQRCCGKRRCCEWLRCSRLLRRCIPRRSPPKPSTE